MARPVRQGQVGLAAVGQVHYPELPLADVRFRLEHRLPGKGKPRPVGAEELLPGEGHPLLEGVDRREGPVGVPGHGEALRHHHLGIGAVEEEVPLHLGPGEVVQGARRQGPVVRDGGAVLPRGIVHEVGGLRGEGPPCLPRRGEVPGQVQGVQALGEVGVVQVARPDPAGVVPARRGDLGPVPLPAGDGGENRTQGSGLGPVGGVVDGGALREGGLVGPGEVRRSSAYGLCRQGSLEGGDVHSHHPDLDLLPQGAGDQDHVPGAEGLQLPGVGGELVLPVRLRGIEGEGVLQRRRLPEDGGLALHGGDAQDGPGIRPLGGEDEHVGVCLGLPGAGDQAPQQQGGGQGGHREEFPPAGAHRAQDVVKPCFHDGLPSLQLGGEAGGRPRPGRHGGEDGAGIGPPLPRAGPGQGPVVTGQFQVGLPPAGHEVDQGVEPVDPPGQEEEELAPQVPPLPVGQLVAKDAGQFLPAVSLGRQDHHGVEQPQGHGGGGGRAHHQGDGPGQAQGLGGLLEGFRLPEGLGVPEQGLSEPEVPATLPQEEGHPAGGPDQGGHLQPGEGGGSWGGGGGFGAGRRRHRLWLGRRGRFPAALRGGLGLVLDHRRLAEGDLHRGGGQGELQGHQQPQGQHPPHQAPPPGLHPPRQGRGGQEQAGDHQPGGEGDPQHLGENSGQEVKHPAPLPPRCPGRPSAPPGPPG